MDQKERQLYLDEAIRVGDELVKLACRGNKGFSWKTIHIDNDLNLHLLEDETIYAGGSGIVLFFLELYKLTGNNNYLDTAVEGMRGVERYCRSNPSSNYAFYTGRMGVSYTLLKMFLVTKDSRYIERALRNSRACDEFYAYSGCNDLLNGISGMLLGLLHLYAATNEKWVLEKINFAIKHIIDSAHMGPEGLYWDRTREVVRGLCGFSHGAAGIGYVLLELGRYFKNESFYWLAGQAFAYEDHFYDSTVQNWPDFRKGIYKEDDYSKHKRAYLKGDVRFFTENITMNAWCHGAAGIGLSRLRAFELLERSQYRVESKNAINKTTETDVQPVNKYKWCTYTLCHGASGNAELFLEAFRIFRDKRYLSLAESIANKALQSKKEKGAYSSGYSLANLPEDQSLFMGTAGIGYFYLRLIDPLNVPSILAPKLVSSFENRRNTNGEIINITIPDLRRTIIAKDFRRTLHILDSIHSDRIEYYLKNKMAEIGKHENKNFMRYVKQEMAKLTKEERRRVWDVYDLELEKIKIENSIPSYALLSIDEIVRSQRVNRLINNDRQIVSIKLRLNPLVHIKLTKWDWNPSSPGMWTKNLMTDSGAYPEILRPSVNGILEESLSSLSYTMLSQFQNEKNVKEVIRAILSNIEPVTPDQKKTIGDIVLQQAKQALKVGILITQKDPICNFICKEPNRETTVHAE